jgi:hypothetical protein
VRDERAVRVRLRGSALLPAHDREDVADDAVDEDDLGVDLDAELRGRREGGGGRNLDRRGDRRNAANLVDRRLSGV